MDLMLVFGSLFVSAFVIAVVLYLVARRVRGLRWFAIFIAVAGLATPLAVVLHGLLSGLIEGEEGISFIVAVFVAPPLLILALAGATIFLLAKREPLSMPVGLATLGAIAYLVVVFIPTNAADKTTEFVIAAAIMGAGALATLGLYLARRPRRLAPAT